MTPASGSKHSRKGPRKKAQPFIVEAVRGGVAVYRRPVGNLAVPRLCGVMPTRPRAVEFARLLARAESAAPDLFLEATDDGIEALEAVIAACIEAVERGADARAPRNAGRRRGRRGRGPRTGPDGAADSSSDGAAGE